MRGLLKLRALLVGLATGALCTGGAIAIAQAGTDSGTSSTATTDSPQTRSTVDTGNGCDLPATLAEMVDLGWQTPEEACSIWEQMQRTAALRQQHPEAFTGPAEFVVEGAPRADLVADCRAGRAVFSEYNDLECNALIMMADGVLKPNDTCGPPACPEEGTPVWRYSITQLSELGTGSP